MAHFLKIPPKKKNLLLLMLISACTFMVMCDSEVQPETDTETNAVRTGAENLIESHLEELQGMRVGLVMNPTARIGQIHVLDTLLSRNVNVTVLFAPEHGFRGEAGAGEVIEDGVDQETGLPVFSLYGETRQPTAEMLGQVDILLFDMQDVGARFYTYNATLGLVIGAAAEYGVPVWVLDRPNPSGGEYISGWILEPEFESFVGMYPIPVAHGMTLGELGKMMIGEQWIDFETEPQYRVITMDGWERGMLWTDTGLEWFPPSPNLPTFEHAFVYLGTCFIEGTSLSEGRGTENPFLLLGSPGTSFEEADLERLQGDLTGIQIEKAQFTPRSIPGKAPTPKYEGEECTGVRLRVTDFAFLEPVEAGLRIMTFLMNHTPDAETNNFLYRLAGTRDIDLFDGSSDDWWHFDTERFEKQRDVYLLYD